MPIKKNIIPESQSEIKTSTVDQKSTKSSPSTTRSLLDSSPSCCNSTLGNANHLHSTESNHPKLSVTSSKTECCKSTASCGTSTDPFAQKQTTCGTTKPEVKKGPKTRIVIRYDVGFNNTLSLRGKGADLNWHKGAALKNIKNDEWVWETEVPFSTCEFKVLINDHHYEIGENHPLSCGASIQYTPKF